MANLKRCISDHGLSITKPSINYQRAFSQACIRVGYLETESVWPSYYMFRPLHKIALPVTIALQVNVGQGMFSWTHSTRGKWVVSCTCRL